MRQNLRFAWAALILSAAVVLGSGAMLFRSFVRHAFVDCQGSLRPVSGSELADAKLAPADRRSDLDIRYDEVKTGSPAQNLYENVRVVWSRAGAVGTCSDLPIRLDASARLSPWSLRIDRDEATGLYAVRDPNVEGPEGARAFFRRTNDVGRRIMPGQLVLGGISVIVLLLSLGALGVAALRIRRVVPYATRMHAWRSATLRHDGTIEGADEARLGVLEAESASRLPAGQVIVDPHAIVPGDGYREVPLLQPTDMASGSHERWSFGTLRRLRDANMIAAVSSIAMIATVAAELLGTGR